MYVVFWSRIIIGVSIKYSLTPSLHARTDLSKVLITESILGFTVHYHQ